MTRHRLVRRARMAARTGAHQGVGIPPLTSGSRRSRSWIRAGQEHVGGRELGGLARAAQRGLLAELRHLLLRLPARDLQRRPDRAGRDGVDPDPLARQLLASALVKVLIAALVEA